MKDKLKAEQELTKLEEADLNVKSNDDESSSNDAVMALQILGYNRKDIDKVLSKIDEGLSTEEIIKSALKYLS